MRAILALLVIVAAIFASMRYSEHHAGTNSKAFEVLYMHIVPAKLVLPQTHSEASAAPSGEHHAHPLLSVPAPFLPALFDGDSSREGVQLVASNLQIFQLAALLLVFVLFSGVPRHIRQGGGDWITRRLAGFALWLRDEVVYPKMGEHHGRAFLPWFLGLFFFILFMNLLGLVPGASTATASIFVTAALAVITLCSMILCGMAVQGPVAFWKHLVPHVPLALWPLMFVVELIGLLVKPFALMVRLFANMSGGHMVVLSFMGLIFFFAGDGLSSMGYAVAPVAVAFAVFIMIIEAFVALLQAYIFTQLSVLFVAASVHPEH
jgi:F-type H+-transporting ATPase subunit a